MTLSPQSPEDYWVRNVLSGVIADISLDEDSDTLAQQLARDMFAESRYISFDHFGLDSLRLHVSGEYDFDFQKGLVYKHEQERVDFTPVAQTDLGALCTMDGFFNDFGEPERFLIVGCLFVANPEEAFRDCSFGFDSNEWPLADNRALIDVEINQEPALIFKTGLATGAHMVYLRTYSPREYDELQKQEGVDVSDFSPLIGTYQGELIGLYHSNYLNIDPAVIVGIEAKAQTGEVTQAGVRSVKSRLASGE